MKKAPPRIRAVTFDVGGTLIRPWPSVGQIYAEVAERHGLRNISADHLERQFKAAWQAQQPFEHTREGWARIVDGTFAGVLDVPPSRTFFGELFARFAKPDVWHVFEDVRPALEALQARGLRLAVISNWDERLRPLLGRLGLEAFFETIVVSCEVGAVKPSPAIFRAALRELDLEAAEVLHVGDSQIADVEGARATGMRALRIRREGELEGEHDVRSLEEIARLVAQAR
jgi:putative hydrolase of the HAD superfamily